MIVIVRWTEWLQNAKVERFADVANARAYEESLPSNQTVWIFDTDEPRWLEAQWISRYGTPKLAEIFRALGGEVKKFANYDAGLNRVGLRILDLARDSDLQSYVASAKSSDVNIDEGNKVMAREYKMGEFKQVRPSTDFGKILAAAFAEPDATVNDIAVAVGLNYDKVRQVMASARRTHGVGHEVGEDGKVTIQLPDGVTETSVFAEVKVTEVGEKTPREYKVGEFKQVRRGGGLGKLVEAAQLSGTFGEIGERLGETAEQAESALKSLRRTHGIDHRVDGDQIHLVLPEGKEPFIAERMAAARTEGEPRKGKNADLDAKAAAGEMPEKPIVTSPTNMHRQKHFDKLAELAAAGEWDAVSAFHMKGVDSYSAMINRYRDRLLAAHNARPASSDVYAAAE